MKNARSQTSDDSFYRRLIHDFSPWFDWLLLPLAFVLVAAVYLPAHSIGIQRRGDELQGVLKNLAKRDAALWRSVQRDQPALAVFEQGGLHAASLAEVELLFRSARQSIKKHVKHDEGSTDEADDGASNSAGKLAFLAQINDSLGSSTASRFFGPEQFICYGLGLWAMLLLGGRWRSIRRQSRALVRPLIEARKGEIFSPERAAWLRDQIDPAIRGMDTGRIAQHCLERFENAHDVATCESLVVSETELLFQERESRLAMVRFVIWAVPSIGFIGTVRGMGSALAEADSPESLSIVVGWLAVAFDTTLIALFLSIALMFVSHLFQRVLEEYVLNVQRKLNVELVGRLHAATAPLTL